MTGDATPPPPVTHVYHPALSVTNVKSLIPLVLDVEKVQYTPWATLFRNTAKVYNVLDHIDPTVKKPKDIDDDLWARLDAIVCQWMYGTISTDLLLKILDDKSTAMEAWERLRNIFQDNKGTRVVHLENQFGNIHLSQFPTLGDYCQALKSLSIQLAAIDHPISEERLVLQLVGKLNSEYRMVATLIQQSTPLPSFDKPCSMLELGRVSREKTETTLAPSDTVLLRWWLMVLVTNLPRRHKVVVVTVRITRIRGMGITSIKGRKTKIKGLGIIISVRLHLTHAHNTCFFPLGIILGLSKCITHHAHIIPKPLVTAAQTQQQSLLGSSPTPPNAAQ